MTKVIKLSEKQIEEKITEAKSKYPKNYLEESTWDIHVTDSYVFNIADCFYYGLKYMDECMDTDWNYKYKTFNAVIPIIRDLEYPVRRQKERIKLDEFIKKLKGGNNDK